MRSTVAQHPCAPYCSNARNMTFSPYIPWQGSPSQTPGVMARCACAHREVQSPLAQNPGYMAVVRNFRTFILSFSVGDKSVNRASSRPPLQVHILCFKFSFGRRKIYRGSKYILRLEYHLAHSNNDIPSSLTSLSKQLFCFCFRG